MKSSSVLSLLATIVVGFVITSTLLVMNQRRMIYHPQRYPTRILEQLGSLEVIHYQSSGHAQQAFWFSQSPKPKHVWILLGGNAALALQWLPLVIQTNTPDSGYLLIDYPGYGLNSGYPSQSTNRQAVLDAYSALRHKYQFSPDVSLLGHSIGTAVAIDVAASLSPQSLLLISPFTSMHAMTERVIGRIWAWILSPFLWDTYRSDLSLRQFVTTHPQTRILIIHGESDKIVPESMGAQLANTSTMITYRTFPGIGHDLPYTASEFVVDALRTHAK